MLIIKGFLIGLGKILPGVSGSLIAISLGLYKEIIDKLSNINIKRDYLFFIKLGIGFILAVTIFSGIIKYFFNEYYLETMLLFVGLILGGTKSIYNKITNKLDIHFTIITIILILLLGLVFNIKITNTNNILIPFLLGIIESITSIIPGISGTAIFVSLGVYDKILYILSNLLSINFIINNLYFLLPFMLGILISVLLLIKIIKYLFNNYESIVYSVILGISIYTVSSMFYKTFNQNYNCLEIIISLSLLVVGYKLSYYVDKK